MIRRADWELQLHTWAASVLGLPFAWGVVDCVQLVRGALLAMTGEDVGARVPEYYDLRSAVDRWNATGGTRAQLLALGCTPVGFSFRQRGDIVLAPDPPFEGAGVCVDGRLLSVKQDDVVQWYGAPPWDDSDVTVLRVPT